MNVLQVILILILLGVVAFFAKISFWRLSEYERLAVFSITGKFKGMRGFRFDFRESTGGGCKDACGHA